MRTANTIAQFSLIGVGASCHRRLQSCVGTQARLGYAAFDAQLRKAYFVTTLTVRYTYICACVSMHRPRVFASGPHDMSTHDLKYPGQCPGMPGPAGAYARGTTSHTMSWPLFNWRAHPILSMGLVLTTAMLQVVSASYVSWETAVAAMTTAASVD